MRTCKDCGKSKQMDDFSAHGSGYRYFCKACDSKKKNEYKKLSRARAKAAVDWATARQSTNPFDWQTFKQPVEVAERRSYDFRG